MKVNYGIYLGLTSASIAKMENGIPVILKSNSLKGRMPVCVYFNRKGSIQVGDTAYNAHRTEFIKTQNAWEITSTNSFVEFGRTIGTDMLYHSTNANKSFSSTELITEIIKGLLSFEKAKKVNSAVITIPDAFHINQINAIREAGELAGLKQVEVVQESIAVALTYELDSIKNKSFSLIFSFDDVFNVSLIKDGQILDTEGDNYLGGKNLDFAIVDEIILPYIKTNFVINSILADDTKKQNLRNPLRYYAEEAKKKLSFNENHQIITDFGDIPGEDDEGEEFEIDITVTQADIERALSPIFQKAIDLSKNLLVRNNLKGSSLDSLVLVGGSTFSPVLRRMLEEQICTPNSSIDPKTVIVKGAALYASTVDISETVRLKKRDKTKIQLEIANEASTVETEEFVPIKILAEKTEGEIPEKVFAEVTRADKAWSSGKVEINTIGEIIEVQLNEGKINIFEVILFDGKGNILESVPNHFKVEQGIKLGTATLAYNIGTEIKDEQTEKQIFRTIKGLEKNQSIPAMGTINGLKTQKPIRPGIESDFIKIPIYEGEHGAEGTRAIYNEHISDIIISGADLPCLLPENSDVHLTINVDKSERITATAYLPSIDFTTESIIKTQHNTTSINQVEDLLFELTENEFLSSNEFQNYFEKLSELKQKNDVDTLTMIQAELKNYGRKA
ncbi:molecular chaperone DnaK [unidentified eubacterium SCB49]|nr:molecular chaperone DnaK [unidentified eubacterium SCB49]